MRRRTLLTAVLATGAMALAGCGNGEGEGYSPDPEALQIYSSQHDNVTKAWADAFTEKTGTKTQIRAGKDSSMGHQIIEEGDASPADVFLTENSPAMTLVADAGLLAPVESSTMKLVDPERRPSGDEWAPIAARSTVLIYNTDMLSEKDLPKSLMDLQEPRYKDQWGAGATGADFQAIVAGMLDDKGEEQTAAWLKGLKDNARIYQNNIATMKAVNSGEVPMGVIYHYYWYRDQAGTKEGSQNTKLHYFKNQDPGAFVSLSAGGILSSADHPEEAQEFLAFVLSPQGQQVLADSGSMEYAVAEGADSDPSLPPLDSLEATSVDPFALDSEKVAELMTDAGIL